MRALSFSCSSWKWKSRSRAALTSCTGTFTSPKLIDPLQSGRGTSAPRADAGFERRHQVVAVLRLLLLEQIYLLARGLALDQVEHRLAIGVLVVLGVVVQLKRIDELVRHVDLALRGFASRSVELQLVGAHHLVVEAQRVQRYHVLERPNGHEVLPVVEGEASDPGSPAAPQGFMEEAVGVLGVAAADVVGLLVEDRVDVGGLNEVIEVDDLAAVAGGRLDFVLLEDDVLVLAHLVALDHLLVGDLLVLLGADALVLDPAPVPRVYQVEVDALRL